jgi:hypothetical protein
MGTREGIYWVWTYETEGPSQLIEIPLAQAFAIPDSSPEVSFDDKEEIVNAWGDNCLINPIMVVAGPISIKHVIPDSSIALIAGAKRTGCRQCRRQ